MKEQKPTFMRNIKIILLAFSITCAIVCFILVSSYNNYKSVNINYLNEVKFKYETRGYLAEYVIYFTALKNGFDKTVYEPMMESTQERLINSIEDSLVSENKKEEILKIVYLQDEADLSSLLNQNTLSFDYQEADAFTPIMNAWYTLFVLLAVLILISTVSYFMFLNQL